MKLTIGSVRVPDLTPEIDLPDVDSAHAPDCAHACKFTTRFKAEKNQYLIYKKL